MGNLRVTRTALILDWLTVCVTGILVVTVVPSGTSVSIFFIPAINVWFAVPVLNSNPTSLKLKSLSLGAELLAACCNICVPLR